jgi:peptide/nickel transport system ATP-binding protein
MNQRRRWTYHQAEILRLIRDLQRESDTAVLFITHDFGVVAEIADSVVVLQQGELVESGPARDILTSPQHPYTRALLEAVPASLRESRLRNRAPPCTCARGKLTKVFDSGGWFRRTSHVTAIDALDLEVHKGETLGIVGESGSENPRWRGCFCA